MKLKWYTYFTVFLAISLTLLSLKAPGFPSPESFHISADNEVQAETTFARTTQEKHVSQLTAQVLSTSGYSDFNYMKKDLIETAKQLTGLPYNRDGSSPEDGFSTASLTQFVYKEAEGILLSRKAALQKELGTKVKQEDLIAGDLLFFKNKSGGLMSGIYLGNGDFIIAANSGVGIRNINDDLYWATSFHEAKRLTPLEKAKLNPETYKDFPNAAIQKAVSMLHRPYLLTGNTLAAFDCSFLVQHAFKDLHIHLPRITYQQWQLGEEIPLKKAVPGDVLYFSGTWQKGISHTGIYLGDRFFIHASGEEGETTISYLGDFWLRYFTGVRRFDNLKIETDKSVVEKAYKLLNIPYASAGKHPEEGFNYSGLIYFVYKEIDPDFPKKAAKQRQYGKKIEAGEEEPGDVFFFRSGSNNLLPAIYIGQGQLIAVRQDEGVSIIDPRFSHYWTEDRLEDIRRYE